MKDVAPRPLKLVRRFEMLPNLSIGQEFNYDGKRYKINDRIAGDTPEPFVKIILVLERIEE